MSMSRLEVPQTDPQEEDLSAVVCFRGKMDGVVCGGREASEVLWWTVGA